MVWNDLNKGDVRTIVTPENIKNCLDDDQYNENECPENKVKCPDNGHSREYQKMSGQGSLQ